MVQRLQRFGSYNRFKQVRSFSYDFPPAMLNPDLRMTQVEMTPGQAMDVQLPCTFLLLLHAGGAAGPCG
jgi:hypothetical protein